MPNEKSEAPQSYSELLKFVLFYLRPYRGRFIISTISRLIGELVYTSNPYLFAMMITLIAKSAPLQSIYLYFALWGGSFFVRIGGQRTGRWISNRMAEKALIDVEQSGLDQLVAWPLVIHEAEDTGNKLKMIQKGAEGIKAILRLWQDQWIGVVSHVVTMLTVVFIISWRIGLLLVAFLVTYYFISRPLLRRAGQKSRRVNRQDELVSGFIFEIVNNIRTTKVMQLYPWLRARLQSLTGELYKRIEIRSGAYQSTGAICGAYAQIIRILFVGSIIFGVINGRFDLAFLIMFINYFNNLRDSTEIFSESLEEFAIARYGIARFSRLKELADKNADTGKKIFPANWQQLSLNNVSFAYGDNPVLSGINFNIKRGERIGIVGLSGAGKSTLFKLLLKEHSNYTGQIAFDGVDIKDIDTKSFAQYSAVVLQDTEVFDLTLKENIALSLPKLKEAESRLKMALEVSHVKEFAEHMPQGLETLIGEKGIKLSGGEKQRLGIARAIYKQPQILFLDEATSHLDLESEEKIRDSLHKFFQTVTAVVIAHRLTTIKEMDRILVMEGGKIIEEGSFDKLYKKKGRFYDLWEKQKL